MSRTRSRGSKATALHVLAFPNPGGRAIRQAKHFDGWWRKAYAIAYRGMRVWWFLRRPTSESAYVAVWHDGALLLIRNSYKPGETLPSGGLKRNETPLAAAQRELQEEVGLRVGERDLDFACELVVHFDYKREISHFFELRCASEPPIEVDGREVIWAAFCNRDELPSRPLLPHVRAYLERGDAAASAL